MAECLFCGRQATLTREHVIAQWLRELIRTHWGDAPVTMGAASLADPQGRSYESNTGIEVVTRTVCARCNNDWMNGLEIAARPLLTPMVLGEPVSLTPNSQSVIAGWLAKIEVLMHALEIPPTEAPLARRRSIERWRYPPGDAHVWLGRFADSHERAYSCLRYSLNFRAEGVPNARRYDSDGDVCTLQLGELLLQIVYTGNGAMTLTKDDDAIVKIWPNSHKSLRWPCDDLMFDTAGLTEFARSWNPDAPPLTPNF